MKKILIVDDDAELRMSLSEILKGAGYLTDEAASGNEAITKIFSEDFDIALLDLMMPGMNGIEALKEIRMIGPKPKAIMITAFATIDNAVDAIKKGASDYISKPFKMDELLTTIRRVLEEASFESSIKKLDIEHTMISLSNPIRRNIMRMLNTMPGMRLMEICRELGIEEHTKVVFHMKMLKESGIIEQDKEKAYSLTKEGEKAMDFLKALDNYL